MPVVKVNAENAFILEVPPVKPITDECLSTCFFDTLSCLISDSSSKAGEIIKEIRKYILNIERRYTACGNLFQIMQQHSVVTGDDRLKKLTINNPELPQVLKKYLLYLIDKMKTANYQFSNEIPTESICNNYIDNFIKFFKFRQDFAPKNLLQWFKLLEEHVVTVEAMILQDVAHHYQNKLGIKLETILKEFETVTNIPSHEPTIQDSVLVAATHSRIAELGGFKAVTTWNPNQTFDDMMNAIKQYGYLIVGGKYGKSFHRAKPKQQKVGELSVFSWAKDSFVNTPISGHVVIVIGVSKKGYANTSQNLVYFIDPTRDYKENIYPIYISSEKSFFERMADRQSIMVEGLRSSNADLSKNTYFLYHPTHMPMLQQNQETISPSNTVQTLPNQKLEDNETEQRVASIEPPQLSVKQSAVNEEDTQKKETLPLPVQSSNPAQLSVKQSAVNEEEDTQKKETLPLPIQSNNPASFWHHCPSLTTVAALGVGAIAVGVTVAVTAMSKSNS